MFLKLLKHEIKLGLADPINKIAAVLLYTLVITVPIIILSDSPIVYLGYTYTILWFSIVWLSYNIFREDYSDGTFEQYLLLPITITQQILVKWLSTWLVIALPLSIITIISIEFGTAGQLLQSTSANLLIYSFMCVGIGMLIGTTHLLSGYTKWVGTIISMTLWVLLLMLDMTASIQPKAYNTSLLQAGFILTQIFILYYNIKILSKR